MEDEVREMPLVSVVVPCYNHEKYVEQTIKSIVNQTYRNIELIIINDGSKDNSHDVILTYIEICKERFVRFEYRNRINIGLSGTLNEMLEWAKGKYFSPIASDDVLINTKIETLVSALEHRDKEFAVAFGNVEFINDKNEIVRLDEKGHLIQKGEIPIYNNFCEYHNKKFNLTHSQVVTYEMILQSYYIPAAGVVMTLNTLKEVGGWTAGNVVEDLEMWFKLSKKYKFVYVDEIVALYRVHENNTINTMPKELHFDISKILIKEKTYAIQNGFTDIYYSRLYNSTLVPIMIFLYRSNYGTAFKFIVNLMKLDFVLVVKMLPRLMFEIIRRTILHLTKKINEKLCR